MGEYNLGFLTKKIYNSKISLFQTKTLKDILEVKKEATLFKIIEKLLKTEILVKIEKGKYLLKDADIHDFALANFIYEPSYISFESALNFQGILSQFPRAVFSATPKRTNKKKVAEKSFVYNHLKKELFWGYQKKDNFFIAFPEKALLDQLYFAGKGYKKIDFEEYNFDQLNLGRLRNFMNKFPKTRQFNNMKEKLKFNLKI